MNALPSFAGFAVATLLAGIPLGAGAQTELAKDSPFAPATGSATATGAAPQAFELAGAGVTNGGTEVCIYSAQTKHSYWIAVGTSREGIQVLSFDPDQDRAVISLNGEKKTLSLRKAVVTAMSVAGSSWSARLPSPVVAAGIPLTPTDPKSAEYARQAREARMFVSDLLEIGIQQRKAYAEAKKNAAAQHPGGG